VELNEVPAAAPEQASKPFESFDIDAYLSTEEPEVPVVPEVSEPQNAIGVAMTTPIELPEDPPVTPEVEVPSLGLPDPQPAEPAVAAVPAIPELPEEDLDISEGPPTGTGRNGQRGGRDPVSLPPELLGGKAGGTSVKEAAENTDRRRGRLLLIAGVVVTAILLALLTSPAWRRKSSVLPAEVLVAKEEAVALLRRDDMPSREEAIERLRGLMNKYPDRVDFQAEMAVALALQLDDLRLSMAALQTRADELRRDMLALEEARAPADWEIRVNAMREELALVQQRQAPLGTRIATLMDQVMKAERRLALVRDGEPKEDALARLRGRGVLAAVTGLGETFVLADRLAQEGQTQWSALVLGEYVVNAAASPELLLQAAEGLGRVREKDSTLLRPYVLGARIALVRKDPASAQALLDTVIALNPKHEIARQLQAQAEEAARKKEPGR
jgi:hypothetical protein